MKGFCGVVLLNEEYYEERIVGYAVLIGPSTLLATTRSVVGPKGLPYFRMKFVLLSTRREFIISEAHYAKK
jgi:hypothetical protein